MTLNMYPLAYLDDLFILSSSMLENHLDKLGKIFQHLKNKNLPIDASKSTFATDEIDVYQPAFESIKIK